MSNKFVPITIPPGVVSMPTKNMRSSNWAEVNLVRWVEGELQPVGGQEQLAYTFASRCKAIHPWFDLQDTYHVAYVCEQHVYVDTNGTLAEITPTGGWPSPTPSGEGGYGDGPYGDDPYGTPRAAATIEPVTRIPPMWSVDNFGAILLVMYSEDGRLLEWDPALAPTLLTPTTSSDTGTGFAPTGRCFVVTQERFVVIFGMQNDGTTGGGSFRRFGWCDQEARNKWDFTNVISQAGFLDVEPSSPIITAISGGRFGTLFWTAKKCYVTRYQGLPFVFGYSELSDNCTPWSPASMTTTSQYVLWMSEQGLFSFDGTSVSTSACAVRSWITHDLDFGHARSQACAFHNAWFNEFWWFFPQASTGTGLNTRVVIYSYKEGWWSMGTMSRSAGVTASYSVWPLLADGTVAFQHEIGNVYNNATPPWAETFDLNLTSGARLITLKQVIPDVRGDMANLQFSFFTRNSRSLSDTAGQWSTPVPIRADGYVDARVTGRACRMKISTVTSTIQPFTLGEHLVDFAVRGDR